MATPWPTGRRDLATEFRARYYAEEQIPRAEQATLLLRLARVYERHGLRPTGTLAALCDLCPHAETCWAGLPRSAYRRPTQTKDEDGAFVLPWVGPGYEPDGVVVVGINPNVARREPTTWDLEHAISWEHYVKRTFDQNRLTEDGSRFGGDSLRAAGLVLDSLANRPIRDRAAGELTSVLMRTARLQTVKCVPKAEQSRPTAQMAAECPTFLLGDELKVLKPARIVTFGAVAREGLQSLAGYEQIATRADRFSLGDLVIHGERVRVYHLDHPRYLTGFRKGFAALRRRLNTDQHDH